MSSDTIEGDHSYNMDELLCDILSIPKSNSSPEQVEIINNWIDLKEVMKVIEDSNNDEWHWGYNSKCKYISVRIDMRNGCCLLSDRNGNRITLDELKYQYSDNTKNGVNMKNMNKKQQKFFDETSEMTQTIADYVDSMTLDETNDFEKIKEAKIKIEEGYMLLFESIKKD